MTDPEIRAKALELTISLLGLTDPSGLAEHPAARTDDVLSTVRWVEEYLVKGTYDRTELLRHCPGGDLHGKLT